MYLPQPCHHIFAASGALLKVVLAPVFTVNARGEGLSEGIEGVVRLRVYKLRIVTPPWR